MGLGSVVASVPGTEDEDTTSRIALLGDRMRSGSKRALTAFELSSSLLAFVFIGVVLLLLLLLYSYTARNKRVALEAVSADWTESSGSVCIEIMAVGMTTFWYIKRIISDDDDDDKELEEGLLLLLLAVVSILERISC